MYKDASKIWDCPATTENASTFDVQVMIWLFKSVIQQYMVYSGVLEG